MSVISEVFSFAARESRAAIHLYFEPLQLLRRLLSSRRRGNVETSALYAERAFELARQFRSESGAPPVRISIVGGIGTGKTSFLGALAKSEGLVQGDSSYLDPVRPKVLEWNGIILTDWPAYSDLLIDKERAIQFLARDSDLILIVLDSGERLSEEDLLEVAMFRKTGKPILVLLSRVDLVSQPEVATRLEAIERETGLLPIPFSSRSGLNVPAIREVLLSWAKNSRTGGAR